MGLVPEGAYKNRKHAGSHIDVGTVEEHYIDLLYDPQTSGGLLLSVPKEEADAVMEDFEKKHMDTKVSIIGQVLEEETNGKNIRLV